MTMKTSFHLGAVTTCLLAGLVPQLGAATFTVTTTKDTGPGSLRAAIQAANANPGADLIAFDLPGTGVQTISPLSELPALTNAVTLDGYTQPGSQPNTLATGSDARLLIRLDGRSCTNSIQPSGLKLWGSGHVVRGLVIVKFSRGIMLDSCNNSVIVGNWVGLDVDGLASGHTFEGLYVSCPVFSSSTGVRIGTPAPADRNVISGNGSGIFFFGSTVGYARVEGNYIGTDPTGSLPRPNNNRGVFFQSANNMVVGGTTAGARNVISGNTGAGVYVLGGTNITVQGNYIGLDATGLFTVANTSDGVVLQTGLSGCTIGGNTPGAGNVISGNQNGIYLLGATSNTIYANFIGTDATGTRALGNRGAGISLFGAQLNWVGGPNASMANLIAYNQAIGVSLSGQATNITVRGNRIFGNRGLGIDLNADGLTPNDPDDKDTGANGLLNSPSVTAAVVGGSSVRVQGSFSGLAGQSLTLDLYATTAWDYDGLPEGQQWLGSTGLTTGPDGSAAFDVALNGSVVDGAWITATVTDAAGNTSEFSAPATATQSPGAPPLGYGSFGGTNYLIWPQGVPGLGLEASLALGPAANWFPVSTGILVMGTNYLFPVVPVPGLTNEFFRLTTQ